MKFQQQPESRPHSYPVPVEGVTSLDFDPYASEVLRDPYPHYEMMREAVECPRGVVQFEC